MNNRYLLILIVAIGAFGLAACSPQQKATQTNSADTPITSIVCGKEKSLVCGVDGVTYDNACIATEQHGVAIATQGECPPRSAMTDYERKYLFWLLEQRQSQKLPAISIKLQKTILQPCTLECNRGTCGTCNSYDLYYDWGQPLITARIKVSAGTVTNAVDTTGYDYLAKKQGTPIDFPELSNK